MKHAVRHIHFVGVGGSGMSGIAEVLCNGCQRIPQCPADLKAAPDDRSWPLLRQRLSTRNILRDVVFSEVCIAIDAGKRAGHHRKKLHLARNQRSVFGVCRHPGEVAKKSNLNQDH